jgi:hypothetical protein
MSRRGQIAGALVAVVLAISSPALAQTYQDPAQQWDWSMGQGISQGAVENDTGGWFAITCASGTDNPVAGMMLTIDAGGPVAAEAVDAVIEIDGEETWWTIRSMASRTKDVTYSADIGSAAFADFARMVDHLKRGRSLVVSIPAHSVRQEFTLRGSAAALSDILEGCK